MITAGRRYALNAEKYSIWSSEAECAPEDNFSTISFIRASIIFSSSGDGRLTEVSHGASGVAKLSTWLIPITNLGIEGFFGVGLLFKDMEHLDGIDLATIEDTDPIIEDKIRDLYENVFADIFVEFDNVSMDSVAIYSVLQNWHLDYLKNKLYSLIF